MSEQKPRLPLLLDTGALALGEYVVLDIDYKTVQCFATIEDAEAFIAEANGWQHSPGFQLNPPRPRIWPIPPPVARSELFGGLLKSLSHIVPSRLSSLLEVLPRLGSGFTKLVELVAGYLLLGLEVSHLFVPACLGLVLQGVSLFMQPCDFFLHFRETGLEARLKVFLGLRGGVGGGIASFFRVATDVFGCDFADRVLHRGLHAASARHDNRCTEQPAGAGHGLTSCRTTKIGSVRVALSGTR